MSKYKIKTIQVFNQETILIVRDDDAQISTDEENADYRDYLAWVAEGNTAEEWQPESEGM